MDLCDDYEISWSNVVGWEWVECMYWCGLLRFVGYLMRRRDVTWGGGGEEKSLVWYVESLVLVGVCLRKRYGMKYGM